MHFPAKQKTVNMILDAWPVVLANGNTRKRMRCWQNICSTSLFSLTPTKWHELQPGQHARIQLLEADMTFLWLDNDGLPRRPSGRQRFERRIDDRTANDIADALRAHGIQPAALAMDYLEVDMDVALRVLAGVSARRGTATAVAATLDRRQRQRGHAGAVGFTPELSGA
jgi:hypothetical protein